MPPFISFRRADARIRRHAIYADAISFIAPRFAEGHFFASGFHDIGEADEAASADFLAI
jgi:hypothetical protein